MKKNIHTSWPSLRRTRWREREQSHFLSTLSGRVHSTSLKRVVVERRVFFNFQNFHHIGVTTTQSRSYACVREMNHRAK